MVVHTVQEFMTPEVITIQADAPLKQAMQLMRERAVRHLPVVEHGVLVGIVSERDVHDARMLRTVDLATARVALVVSVPPLTVPPDMPLSDVAARMIDRRVGSVIVTQDSRIVGIFTTHDALLALHHILGSTALS